MKQSRWFALPFALFLAMPVAGASSVVGWGDNSFNQTNIPSGLTNAVALACGDLYCLALKTDGKVTGWGDNEFSQATPPASLSNVVAIAAGSGHSLALRSNGTVFA